MVFSFGNEREHLSLAGNLGFPVRDAPLQAVERLSDGQGPSVAVGPKSDLYKAGNDCDARKLDFRRTEIPSEGCADAMSADSSLSLTSALIRFKAMGSGGVRRHPKRLATTGGFGWRFVSAPRSTTACSPI